jgi:formylglycine-generating enzyme required for sulfatase activity
MRVRAAAPDPLTGELEASRRFLQRAVDPVAEELWARQVSPAYSPIGWHLGHVAAVQARWLLPGEPLAYGTTFDPTAVAKTARVKLPAPTELRCLLDDVLERVCAGLRAGRVPGILGLPETFLVQHVAQHELQHGEHIQVIAAIADGRLHRMPPALRVRSADRLEFPGGRFSVGAADAARAYDNERPPHEIDLSPWWMDRAPVSAGEYAAFVSAGGYKDATWWTAEGWQWRTEHDVRAPLAFREQRADAPVTCVSWYEADAYARWRGARLPTEHELEVAKVEPAGVWEWTSSWFCPYPGFRSYPYQGYSVPWFGTHRVLRGGSWATAPELLRPTLRNWYEPGAREIPGGFRCAGGM